MKWEKKNNIQNTIPNVVLLDLRDIAIIPVIVIIILLKNGWGAFSQFCTFLIAGQFGL